MFVSTKSNETHCSTHCRVMKLADMPSCLGGEDKGQSPVDHGDIIYHGDLSGLTASWRFESFPYSHHFWVNVVYFELGLLRGEKAFFIFWALVIREADPSVSLSLHVSALYLTPNKH